MTRFRLSALAIILVLLTAFATWFVVKERNEDRRKQEREAESARLVEANSFLAIGDAAVLNSLVSPPLGHASLLITLHSLHCPLAPTPTAQTMSTDEYWDSDLSEEPDEQWFSMSAKKMGLWACPPLGDVLVGADLKVSNTGKRDASIDLTSWRLEGESFALEPSWWIEDGEARRTTELTVPVGESVRGILVFCAEEDDLAEVRRLAAEPDYSLGTAAASWGWYGLEKRWKKVFDVSGTGGPFVVGSRSIEEMYGVKGYTKMSGRFRLSGGRAKFIWTLRPKGPYTDQGPFFLLDLGAASSVPMELDPMLNSPLMWTDYYHRGSLVYDARIAPGRYFVVVLAANCEWRLDVLEQRWVPSSF